MSSATVYVGVDISKRTLFVDPIDHKSPSVPNNARGIRRLLERFQAFPGPLCVCCEATGGYERALLGALQQAGISVALLNPKRVRDFANSKGIVAKTDKIDARVLSAFGHQNRPRAWASAPPALAEAQALLTRRQELLDMRQQELSRLDPPPPPAIARLIKNHIRSLDRQCGLIETLLRAAIDRHPALAKNLSRLTQVKGVGPVSAMSLLAFVPELGHISDKQAAALVGVAPFNQDSGSSKKRRTIRGGRARVRKALYMATISASHFNPILKPFYERLIAQGKPPKVARVAVMRKLVVLANRILADPSFQPA